VISKSKGYIVSNFYYLKHQFILKYSKKIIIGASDTMQKGWFSSDLPEIDITSIEKCSQYWKRNSKKAFLAEHVWEHLDKTSAKSGAKCCFYFLKNKGRLRVAVPDGFHPCADYIEKVKPNGTGAGSDEHKVLYTIESLSKIFRDAGFFIKPLEYWDSKKKFHRRSWNEDWGKISRSADNDSRNTKENPLAYTSIIIDCIKS
jgi:predicted SAM-dependent methyltransferase